MEKEGIDEVRVAEMLREIVDNYDAVHASRDKEIAELTKCLFEFIRKARDNGFDIETTGSFNR